MATQTSSSDSANPSTTPSGVPIYHAGGQYYYFNPQGQAVPVSQPTNYVSPSPSTLANPSQPIVQPSAIEEHIGATSPQPQGKVLDLLTGNYVTPSELAASRTAIAGQYYAETPPAKRSAEGLVKYTIEQGGGTSITQPSSPITEGQMLTSATDILALKGIKVPITYSDMAKITTGSATASDILAKYGYKSAEQWNKEGYNVIPIGDKIIVQPKPVSLPSLPQAKEPIPIFKGTMVTSTTLPVQIPQSPTLTYETMSDMDKFFVNYGALKVGQLGASKTEAAMALTNPFEYSVLRLGGDYTEMQRAIGKLYYSAKDLQPSDILGNMAVYAQAPLIQIPLTVGITEFIGGAMGFLGARAAIPGAKLFLPFITGVSPKAISTGIGLGLGAFSITSLGVSAYGLVTQPDLKWYEVGEFGTKIAFSGLAGAMGFAKGYNIGYTTEMAKFIQPMKFPNLQGEMVEGRFTAAAKTLTEPSGEGRTTVLESRLFFQKHAGVSLIERQTAEMISTVTPSKIIEPYSSATTNKWLGNILLTEQKGIGSRMFDIQSPITIESSLFSIGKGGKIIGEVPLPSMLWLSSGQASIEQSKVMALPSGKQIAEYSGKYNMWSGNLEAPDSNIAIGRYNTEEVIIPEKGGYGLTRAGSLTFTPKGMSFDYLVNKFSPKLQVSEFDITTIEPKGLPQESLFTSLLKAYGGEISGKDFFVSYSIKPVATMSEESFLSNFGINKILTPDSSIVLSLAKTNIQTLIPKLNYNFLYSDDVMSSASTKALSTLQAPKFAFMDLGAVMPKTMFESELLPKFAEAPKFAQSPVTILAPKLITEPKVFQGVITITKPMPKFAQATIVTTALATITEPMPFIAPITTTPSPIIQPEPPLLVPPSLFGPTMQLTPGKEKKPKLGTQKGKGFLPSPVAIFEGIVGPQRTTGFFSGLEVRKIPGPAPRPKVQDTYLKTQPVKKGKLKPFKWV